MGRLLLGILLTTLLAGCTNTFSRCMVVRTPAAAEATGEGVADEPGALHPGDITSAAGWGPGGSTSTSTPSTTTPSKSTPSTSTPSSTWHRKTAPALSTSPSASTWRTYQADPLVSPTSAEAEAFRRRCCLKNARRSSNLLFAGLVGGIVVYGISFFDYGSSSYQIEDDGWFEESNKDGGSDKWGHATSTHIQTAVYSALNRGFGLPRKEAALRGALTAWSVQFVMEVGDGFSSQFGSSWTDLVANTVGAAFGYFHETSPRFNRLFDLRWEYWPSDQVTSGVDYELSTDIEGSSYVIAVNLGAVYSRRSNFLDYFDFQCGWASRHYKDKSSPPERRPFIGLGINLTNVCKRLKLPILATLFEYYQPPGISLRWDTDLNK